MYNFQFVFIRWQQLHHQPPYNENRKLCEECVHHGALRTKCCNMSAIVHVIVFGTQGVSSECTPAGPAQGIAVACTRMMKNSLCQPSRAKVFCQNVRVNSSNTGSTATKNVRSTSSWKSGLALLLSVSTMRYLSTMLQLSYYSKIRTRYFGLQYLQQHAHLRIY